MIYMRRCCIAFPPRATRSSQHNTSFKTHTLPLTLSMVSPVRALNRRRRLSVVSSFSRTCGSRESRFCFSLSLTSGRAWLISGICWLNIMDTSAPSSSEYSSGSATAAAAAAAAAFLREEAVLGIALLTAGRNLVWSVPPRAAELEIDVFGFWRQSGKVEKTKAESLPSHSPAFEPPAKTIRYPSHHVHKEQREHSRGEQRWGSSRSYPSGPSTCPSGRRPTPESWSTYAVCSRQRCPTCARTPPSRPPTFGCICAPGTASASRTRWRLTSWMDWAGETMPGGGGVFGASTVSMEVKRVMIVGVVRSKVPLIAMLHIANRWRRMRKWDSLRQPRQVASSIAMMVRRRKRLHVPALPMGAGNLRSSSMRCSPRPISVM